MQGFEHWLQRGQVEPCRAIRADTEITAGNLAAKGCALKKQEAGCPFQIG